MLIYGSTLCHSFWFVFFVTFSLPLSCSVRFSDPIETPPSKRPRPASPSSPIQMEACDSTTSAPSPPSPPPRAQCVCPTPPSPAPPAQAVPAPAPPPPAEHSDPDREQTEYWFKQFLARLDKFVDMLLIYALPTIQRIMCRNHCNQILWRLQNCVKFVHMSVGTLCRVTETLWWVHTDPFVKAVAPPEQPIECRPWHTAYQHQTVRTWCRERLFHSVQIARDLQDQMRGCLCCARHARKFCVDLIQHTDRLKTELCDSIRTSCKLY